MLVACACASAGATEVVDNFDQGNPDHWVWSGSYGMDSSTNPVGGNPGGWVDSLEPFYSSHPAVTSFPSAAMPLHEALASGSLHALRIDLQRLATDEETCSGHSIASSITLQLADLHSDPNHGLIEADTTLGPATPADAFPWTTYSFEIPSGSLDDVPEGWRMSFAPELDYNWQDLMRNVDAISVFIVDPQDIVTEGCWHFGADNVVVTYGDTDVIFAEGFDGAP
jgi:hypothetical protein